MMVDRAATFWRAFSAGLLMLAAAGPIARAELVILTSGRAVKALSHQVTGDRVEIRLPDGNSYTVDRKLVERIVDDEVAASDGKTLPQSPRHVEAPAPVRKEPAAVTVAALEEPAQPPSEETHHKSPRRHHGRHRH